MKLGFKVGFVTTLGVLAAYYLYLIATALLNPLVVQPVFLFIGRLLGQ